MAPKKITGKEIAKMAGVSPTTVSLVKKGKMGVGEETRSRIIKLMLSTKYCEEPDGVPYTYNILQLYRNDITAMEHLVYTELSMSIMSACAGMSCRFIQSALDGNVAPGLYDKLLQPQNADAAFIYGDPNLDLLNRLSEMKIPFVILDSSRKKEECCAVRVDYEKAAYMATSCLIELGHTDLAYIGNNSGVVYDFNLQTFSGFQTAMTEHSLSIEPNRIQFNAADEESLYVCLDHALSGHKRPSAILCTTDHSAIIAIHYLWSKGMRIPEDISIIGIDDLSLSKYIVPSLATVKIDRQKMGQRGAELMSQLLKGRSASSVLMSDFEVLKRDSLRVWR